MYCSYIVLGSLFMILQNLTVTVVYIFYNFGRQIVVFVRNLLHSVEEKLKKKTIL